MGLTNKLGLLAQSVQQDTSLNIGIGGAANASYKLQVTGTTNLTGALSGTSATFVGRIGTSLTSTGVNLANSSLYVNNTANTKGAIFGYDDSNDRFYFASIEHGVQYKPILFNTSAATFSSSVTATSISTVFKEGFIVQATTTSAAGSQPAYTYYTAAGSKRWSSFLDVGSDKFHIAGSANTELFTIQQNGNVGIGETAPSYLLHLKQETGNTAMFMKRVTNDTNFEISVQESRTRLRTWSTANDRDIYFDTDNAGTTRMIIKAGGDVQVNNTLYWFSSSDSKSYGFTNLGDGLLSFTSVQFGVKGNFNAFSGVYTATSDINIKKDFEESTIGLDAIMGLKPTLFKYKDDPNQESEKDLGFIAQEVKEFIPQAYHESGSFIGLKDRPIIAALVKAIQELKAEIDQLKAT